MENIENIIKCFEINENSLKIENSSESVEIF